jgi:hypothetical protein
MVLMLQCRDLFKNGLNFPSQLRELPGQRLSSQRQIGFATSL